MKAHRVQVKIGRDHRIVVDVPADMPEGPAEVIVLVPEQHEAADDFASFLQHLRNTSPGRSKEDIDRQVEEERSSWGES